MAYLMEYIVHILIIMIVPAMATFCEFYFYDGNVMKIRAYYKYCTDGCCTENCCYYYNPDTVRPPSPDGAIIGIAIGCVVGLGLCIGFCICFFKLFCKSEAAQSGQIIRQSYQIAYVHSAPGTGSNLGQHLTVAYGYPGTNNQTFTCNNQGPPPAYEDPLPTQTPCYHRNSPSVEVTTGVTGSNQRGNFTNIDTITDYTTSPSSAPPDTDIPSPSDTNCITGSGGGDT